MTKAWLFAGAVMSAALAAFACSSSSNGGGGASSCFTQTTSNQACVSCVESKCSSQLSAAESACSDFANCICPGGTYSQSAAASSTCQQKANEGSCPSAGQAISQCESQSCASECSGTSSSSGGGSSGGGSSGSSSSGGGTPTGSCATLANCCSSFPSSSQASCNQLADTNDQQSCQLAVSAYQDAGLCP